VRIDERTDMGTKLQDRFFQDKRLNPGDDDRLGAGKHDVPIHLLPGQRTHSRASRKRCCRQRRPSHSK
jgi:hypothetical protein